MILLRIFRVFCGLWFSFSLIAICFSILPYLAGVSGVQSTFLALMALPQSLIAWFLFKYLTKKINSKKQ